MQNVPQFNKKIKIAFSSKWTLISILPLAVLLLLFGVASVLLFENTKLIDVISLPLIYLFLSVISVNFIIDNYQMGLDDKTLKLDSSLDDFIGMRYSRKHDEKYKFLNIVVFPITRKQLCILLSLFVFCMFCWNVVSYLVFS